MQKWGSVYLTGSDEYKARCVELAVEHGIKITNPELRDAIDKQTQQKRIADIEEKMIKWSHASKKVEQFKQYHEAVGASRYRVSATQIREDGSKRGFMVNKSDGAPDGFTASEVIGKMKRLISLQDGGRNIYLTPVSDDKHHLLIDDLDHEDLAAFLADGYRPCAIIETSPNNFQAIITIPKLGTEHDHEIANRIVRDLNTKYGDPKLSGEVHAHRAPGFENRKPKHQRDDGTFPETRLVNAERVECTKTSELARSLLEALQRQEADRQKRLDGVMSSLPSDKSGLDVMKAYELHFNDILRIQKNERKSGISRLDSMTTVRLRATGHSKEEVREAIELLAPRMHEALGEPTDTHRWPDYAARTAGYAFGKGGEKSLEKLSPYIEHWKKLEEVILPKAKSEREPARSTQVKPEDPAEQTAKTPTPKTRKAEQTQEAPVARPSAPQKLEPQKPKPLSLKADKDRLSDLVAKVNAHANAYAKQKMDEMDNAEVDRLRPLIKEAKKELADAQEAYEALHEQGPGIKWYHTKKKAAELQEAFNEESGRLDMLRQHAQKKVDNIEFEHVSHSAQEARQSQIDGSKRKGRDEYDSQHLEEAAERKELEQVVGLSEKQRQDVLKLIELEKARGLTEEDATAKHEIIRKFLDTVDKTQAKIAELQRKGQDRDQDMER